MWVYRKILSGLLGGRGKGILRIRHDFASETKEGEPISFLEPVGACYVF